MLLIMWCPHRCIWCWSCLRCCSDATHVFDCIWWNDIHAYLPLPLFLPSLILILNFCVIDGLCPSLDITSKKLTIKKLSKSFSSNINFSFTKSMLFLLEPSHQETLLSSSSQSQDRISILQLSGHGLVKHKILEHLKDHHHCTLWQIFVVTAESCCMLLYYVVFHLDPVSANRETWYSSIKVTLFLQLQRGTFFGHSLHWIYWAVGHHLKHGLARSLAVRSKIAHRCGKYY
jgi:hypothetical protein